MYYPALEAVKALKENGISTGFINARFVKPLDKDLILKESLKAGKVLTVEDNSVMGGFGSAVKEFLSDKNVIVRSIGINDIFPEQGERTELLKQYGLSAENIMKTGEYLAKEKA